MFKALIEYAHEQFPDAFLPRRGDSHKGSFGNLGIIGGAAGMVGAPLLAGRAALTQGAGRVHIGFAQSQIPLPIDPQQAELMLKTASALILQKDISTWVIGCGLGRSGDSARVLFELFDRYPDTPMVIDADALNILASQREAISFVNRLVVLTPHPTEAARLLHLTTGEVQYDRAHAALRLARQYDAWVILKGQHTLIASPEQVLYANPSGNPGLATGGTGDVLAGMLGALIAQDIAFEQALMAGVWLHGAAADYLVSQGLGPIGLTASEVALAARTLRNRIAYAELQA